MVVGKGIGACRLPHVAPTTNRVSMCRSNPRAKAAQKEESLIPHTLEEIENDEEFQRIQKALKEKVSFLLFSSVG